MIVEFIAQQWELVAILATLVVLLLFTESRKGGSVVTAQSLGQLANKEGAAIIDLRDVKEFREGHIAGAVNLTYNKLNTDKADLEKYKGKPIILVCKMGQHASSIAKQLHKVEGFEQVYRLQGGMIDWRAAQMPVLKD